MHPLVFNVALAVLAVPGNIFGQTVPAGYTIPAETLSPDGRYGVTVPKMESYDILTDARNEVVQAATGRVLGAIQGNATFEGMNQTEIYPARWSADDSMLLWQVDGKWGFNTEIIIKLDRGAIKWQVDLLKLLQQEILKRTRAAVPTQYAAVRANSAGFGSWFKEGFAIDCVLINDGKTLKFPLLARVFLTSNTKGAEGVTDVDSRMTAEVKQDGTIEVRNFHLGQDPPARDWVEHPIKYQSSPP
jgi:hypothetical protein